MSFTLLFCKFADAMKRKILQILMILLLLATSSWAQLLNSPEMMMEKNLVRDIQVIGQEFLDEQWVSSRLDIRKGRSYFPAELRALMSESVKRLYNSGMFADVRVEMEQLDGTDVRFVIYVEEQPTLDTLIIDGNDEVLTEDLELLIDLIPGQVYSRAQVERTRQAFLDHYRTEGFLLAEISVEEELVPEKGSRIVHLLIHEGEKVMVDDIIIHGNQYVSTDDIIGGMGSEIDHWYGDGEFVQATFDSDKDSVLAVCRQYGFLDAEVLQQNVEYLPDLSYRFYYGRVVQNGHKSVELLKALNSDLQNSDHPLGLVARKAKASLSHYHRQHRKNYTQNSAVALAELDSDDDAVALLNRILELSSLRKAYLQKMAAQDTLAAQLIAQAPLTDKGKMSAESERHLVRQILESQYPLARYAEQNSSSKVRLHVHLQEGQRYYAGQFAFVDNEVLSDPMLQSRVSLDSGEVFNFREFEMMRMNLMNAYREEGYLFANLQEKKDFVRDSVLNIAFTVTEGLPAQVRKVTIEGNTKTKDKVIRRQVKLYPGDTYRQSYMERSFRDIMQLNYFDNVLPDIRVVGEQEVDLVFQVSEREAGTGTFSAGVAYSQADGVVGTLGLSIPNCCMGDGQKLDVNVEYGPEKHNYTLGFSEPWLFDRPVRVGGSVNYTWQEGVYDDQDLISWGFSAYGGYSGSALPDYMYLQGSYYFQWNDQGANVDNSLIYYSGIESSIGLTVVRDDKNLPMFPTEGSRLSWTGRLGGIFGSALDGWDIGPNFRFVKNNFKANWWFPIIGDLAIGLENEVGIISGESLRYSSLYRMGGMLGYQGKLRGYSPGSVGYRRLGRSFQSFVAEMTYPVAPNMFWLLAFFDAGNVFGEPYNPAVAVSTDQADPWNEIDPTKLLRDAGVGFRVMVPMLGLLGFDFGWPMDPGENLDGSMQSSVGDMQLNFVISQGF
jgi:outer membrane protein insertion porin family